MSTLSIANRRGEKMIERIGAYSWACATTSFHLVLALRKRWGHAGRCTVVLAYIIPNPWADAFRPEEPSALCGSFCTMVPIASDARAD